MLHIESQLLRTVIVSLILFGTCCWDLAPSSPLLPWPVWFTESMGMRRSVQYRKQAGHITEPRETLSMWDAVPSPEGTL